MAAKMSPKDAIKYFGVRLLTELPLDSNVFLESLNGAKLLSLDYKAHIRALVTRSDKVAFFKEKILEPGPDIHLPILLDVMDDCGDAIAKKLAEDIREATGLLKMPSVEKLKIIEPDVVEGNDKDIDEVKVDELWTEDDLYDMGYGKKAISDMPEAQINILDEVLLLLLTVNKNEDNAALCYLDPLPGHTVIYRYWQKDVAGEHRQFASYLIGAYGKCPAAVRKIRPGAEIGGATTAPTLAFKCFKKLSAIIGMGVACGVEKKTKFCDVLIAEKVNNYDQARLEEGGPLSRGFALPTSDLLYQIFGQQIMWPAGEIKEWLDKCKMKRPRIKQGIILSGPYLIDDKKTKKELIQNFASEAIGIEMEAAYLFRAAQQVRTHMTIVKAVCDFGDGKKHKLFQPTAALLAANCVKTYFDNDATVEMLR